MFVPFDPLLVFPVVLLKTLPVGISNNLMFAENAHPFLLQAIHNLVTFDHSWVLHYPTVMFSIGPMFLSAQYGLYIVSHLHRHTHIAQIHVRQECKAGRGTPFVLFPLLWQSLAYR